MLFSSGLEAVSVYGITVLFINKIKEFNNFWIRFIHQMKLLTFTKALTFCVYSKKESIMIYLTSRESLE